MSTLQDLYPILLEYPNFAEAFLKIKTKDRQIVPLTFNPAQEILWTLIAKQRREGNPVRAAILKARQLGISTFCEGYGFWSVMTNENTNALAVAHDADSTQKIFEITRRFYDYMPMRPMRRYSTKRELVLSNPDEKQRAEAVGLQSAMEIRTAGTIGAGRGATYHFLHLSEVALWPYPEMLVSALFPTVPYDRETVIVLESTAHGAGDWWHGFWQEAKSGGSPFVPIFIPWFVMPEYALDEALAKTWMRTGPISEDEKRLMRMYRLTKAQIAWRRMKIRELGLRAEEEAIGVSGEDLFRQEFPCDDLEAWVVAGLPVFDNRRLKLAYEKASAPTLRGYLDGKLEFHGDPKGPIWVWEPPEPGKVYFIGADVAGGGEGGDFSCVQVILSGDAVQVARWHGRLDPINFAHEIEKLGRWYNLAQVAVEINYEGLAVTSELRRRNYWNQYRWRYLDRFVDKLTEKIGWETNSRTKPLLIAHMSNRIREGTTLMRERELVEEALHFIQPGRGGPGFHDDRIIAFMIGAYCDFLDRPTAPSAVIHTLPEGMARPEGLDPRTHDLGPIGQEEARDWRTL